MIILPAAMVLVVNPAPPAPRMSEDHDQAAVPALRLRLRLPHRHMCIEVLRSSLYTHSFLNPSLFSCRMPAPVGSMTDFSFVCGFSPTMAACDILVSLAVPHALAIVWAMFCFENVSPL